MTFELPDIRPTLSKILPLEHLVHMAPAGSFFLVGGALRDGLLGYAINDIDIAASIDPTPIARQFASDHDSPWFWLDKERKQSRVLIGGDNPLTFDFAPLRAIDILADLSARDFTINSLALPLTNNFPKDRLIDPLHGVDDLQSAQLRMSSVQSFVTDPLRILKGIRHAISLGLVIDEQTCASMIHNAWRLKDVAMERVRQEIWTILGNPSAPHGLELLASTGIGRNLWGGGFDDGLAGACADIIRCRSLWNTLRRSHAVVNHWLEEEVEAGLSREVLLLWVLLLSGIDQGLPRSCAEDWLFSRRAQVRITGLVAVNQRLLQELALVAFQPRAFGLWLQQNGLDAADLLLMALNLVPPGDPIKCISKWIPVAEALPETDLHDLVTGDWLAAEFGLQAGPDIGKLLRVLRDAEIRGIVTDTSTAHAYLRELHQNRD